MTNARPGRSPARGALLAVLLAATGCVQKVHVDGLRLGPNDWRPGSVVAGVGRTDITPPPGYPTGGHGPAGAMARGHWDRLHARAFFFADADGRPLILVSADLFAIPDGLTRAVAVRVARTWSARGLALPPDALVIAATHTHQGPGNYLTASVYNEYGSKYQGFDRPLFDFLTARIADAIDRAITDAREHPEPATLMLRAGRLPDAMFINRSPRTFLTNWNASALLDALNAAGDCTPTRVSGEAATDWALPGCPRVRAVDRSLTAVEVQRGTRTIGALLFFSVHPTALDHAAPFFSADFVGQALDRLEGEQAPGGERAPVFGFFNGAEGDVVARREARDVREVVARAGELATELRRVLAAPGRTLVVDRIDAAQARIVPGTSYATASGAVALSPIPTFGGAALAGGEDDRTVLHAAGFGQEAHEIPRDGQGGKRPALNSQLVPFVRLTGLLAPRGHFPASLPVSLARLGALRIAAVPMEPSTAQGAAIRSALGAAPLALIGLANEYASYAATSDEYAMQDYMAASTIWGPRTGSVLEWALRCLETPPCPGLARTDPRRIADTTYRVGRRPAPERLLGGRAFGLDAVGEPLPNADDGLAHVLRDARGGPARDLPGVEWSETRDSGPDEFTQAVSRRVALLERTADGWRYRTVPGTTLADDDRGTGILTLLRGAPGTGDIGPHERRLVALWLAPILESAVPRGEFRFVVTRWRAAMPDEAPSCLVTDPFTLETPALARRRPLRARPAPCP